jgi:hypothetical protein
MSPPLGRRRCNYSMISEGKQVRKRAGTKVLATVRPARKVIHGSQGTLPRPLDHSGSRPAVQGTNYKQLDKH